MNLISKVAIFFIRALILLPGYFAFAAFLQNIQGHPGLLLRQPGFFWYLYGLQGLLGLLCLMPYPNLLFKKNVRVAFLIIVLVCAFHQVRQTWLPSYYASSLLKNYPEHVKDFNHARQYSKNDGFYTSQQVQGLTLWWVQRPDFYDRQMLVFQTIFSLGPLALFLIRLYQIKHGFTWKDWTLKKGSIEAQSWHHQSASVQG